MNDKEIVEYYSAGQRYLNEYAASGAYHQELRVSRFWLPRYFRRFHIALTVLKDVLPLDASIADIGGGLYPGA